MHPLFSFFWLAKLVWSILPFIVLIVTLSLSYLFLSIASISLLHPYIFFAPNGHISKNESFILLLYFGTFLTVEVGEHHADNELQGASKATSGNLRTTASLVDITDRCLHV